MNMNCSHGGAVTNFQILNLWGNSALPYAFVCLKVPKSNCVWRLVDRTCGKFVPVPMQMRLT